MDKGSSIKMVLIDSGACQNLAIRASPSSTYSYHREPTDTGFLPSTRAGICMLTDSKGAKYTHLKHTDKKDLGVLICSKCHTGILLSG